MLPWYYVSYLSFSSTCSQPLLTFTLTNFIEISPWHIVLSPTVLCCLLFFFRLHCVGCRILGSWPGIKPEPPALGAPSLNYWTTRELHALLLNRTIFLFPWHLFHASQHQDLVIFVGPKLLIFIKIHYKWRHLNLYISLFPVFFQGFLFTFSPVFTSSFHYRWFLLACL